MSDTDQNGEVQPPPEQTGNEVPMPPPNPEGRMTSYARGHGPDGPVEEIDERAEASEELAANIDAIERVMELLRGILQAMKDHKKEFSL